MGQDTAVGDFGRYAISSTFSRTQCPFDVVVPLCTIVALPRFLPRLCCLPIMAEDPPVMLSMRHRSRSNMLPYYPYPSREFDLPPPEIDPDRKSGSRVLATALSSRTGRRIFLKLLAAISTTLSMHSAHRSTSAWAAVSRRSSRLTWRDLRIFFSPSAIRGPAGYSGPP